TIGVVESRSEVAFIGVTSDEMIATFTQTVVYTVNLSAPDLPPYPLLLPGAEVKWFISEAGASGNFTDLGGGIYSASIDTTNIGYGIWGITIRANPAEPDIASTKIQGILTITRIQTVVISPLQASDIVYWGWYGYLDFQYWDETFNVGIDDANVTVSFPGAAPELDRLGNGTYRVNIDTTYLPAAENIVSKFALEISFSKPSYQEARELVYVNLKEVPMEIVVESIEYTPQFVGQLDSLTDIMIPIGDLVNITLLFNDTEYSSDSYVGGLEGAFATPNSFLRGPTIDSQLNVTLHELGSGYYNLIFDTRDPTVAATISDIPYTLFLQMYLANHTRRAIAFRIIVAETPTELVLLNSLPNTLINGESFVLEVFYNDTWHGTGIPRAALNLSVDTEIASVSYAESPTVAGLYLVTVSPQGIWNSGSGFVFISADTGTYQRASQEARLTVVWNDVDRLTWNLAQYGLPVALIAILILIGYVRIWSVPKRLRQINGQIKTIRKGKIPDAIKDVKSRQELVADLFNDTFEELNIKRAAYQMPEESVEIEVPEMGELLMQLAILTNLSPEELDEFKADIAKMRVSEQATFVKEVIDQEAVRAARREGKTVEQVLEEVGTRARRRLSDLEEPKERIPEPIVKPVRKPPEEVERVVSIEEPTDEEPAPEEEIPERLSSFELDELKMELIRRGVPPQEIDVILEQAKRLPRDMVEELINSVGKREE
ncbi:MAG: hypothetical protein AM324_010800, partial [Candidatus Thorarchaeota archaeon SMTZ1-83]